MTCELDSHAVATPTANNQLGKKSSAQIIISELLPSFVSRFAFTLHQFISLYFQFNFIKGSPLAFVVIYSGTAITQAFTVGTWLLFSQASSEALQNHDIEKAEYYNRISFKISVFWTIIGLCVFYPINAFLIKLYIIPSKLWFQYYISTAIAVPIQTFFEGQALRYGSENRRLLKISTFCFYSIVFIGLESIIYFFASAESTWPTAVVFIITGVMMIAWTAIWNTGYSCFGIVNKLIIKTNWKDIISFKNFKSEMKDIMKILTLSSSLTLLKMCFGVGLLLSVTESMSDEKKQISQQGGLLLVYGYFGQIFRITSLCASEFFIKNTYICITTREHKKLIDLIVKAIIIGVMLNGLTMVLLIYVPIIQVFVPIKKDIRPAILFSGISGMCAILNEIALSLCLADSHYIIIGCLGATKMIGLVVTKFLYQKLLGGLHDFYKISFWGEVGGGIIGQAVIICKIISFQLKGKEEEKEKKTSNKKKHKK